MTMGCRATALSGPSVGLIRLGSASRYRAQRPEPWSVSARLRIALSRSAARAGRPREGLRDLQPLLRLRTICCHVQLRARPALGDQMAEIQR